MGQISSKNYQKSFVYDFSVNGGAAGQINLGGAVNGGDTITAIFYTVVSTIGTAAVNIDAGYGFNSGAAFIDGAHTVAVLNANIGKWKQNTNWVFTKVAVGSVSDTGIYLSTPNVITTGVLLLSLTIMQNPM